MQVDYKQLVWASSKSAKSNGNYWDTNSVLSNIQFKGQKSCKVQIFLTHLEFYVGGNKQEQERGHTNTATYLILISINQL